MKNGFCFVLLCSCRGRNEAAEAADRERFMEELEEDAEMRSRVALYKAPAAAAAAAAGAAAGAAVPAPRGMDSEEEDSEGELPQVGAAAFMAQAARQVACCIACVQRVCACVCSSGLPRQTLCACRLLVAGGNFRRRCSEVACQLSVFSG
jgi:hypothetical protein